MEYRQHDWVDPQDSRDSEKVRHSFVENGSDIENKAGNSEDGKALGVHKSNFMTWRKVSGIKT